MHFLRATVTALLVLAVAACGPAAPKFQGSDVTGIGYGRDFRLTDHTGKPRTLADFRGKVVVLFFGYTQCPDVCPTTLSELAATMQKLGPDAARVVLRQTQLRREQERRLAVRREALRRAAAARAAAQRESVRLSQRYVARTDRAAVRGRAYEARAAGY